MSDQRVTAIFRQHPHPYCASCKVEVEEYRLYVEPERGYRVIVHAKCHGKTDSRIMEPDDVRWIQEIVLFRRGQGFDSLNIAIGAR